METVQEVLEKANIVRDIKARRVLNTAPEQDSGITLDEIQKGITIERLQSLEVPVYVYGGQVTIHGTFKDDVKDLRVAGYKSVFYNHNGSLGVKYAAIDGDKKLRLEKLSRLQTIWSVNINSQGCQAYRSFQDKQQAIDCYKNTPDCFIGTKTAFAGVFGNFYVVLEIGAIYDSEFWKLVKELTGLDEETAKTKEEEAKARRAEQEAKWEKEAAERRIEDRKKEEAKKLWMTEKYAALSKTFQTIPYSGFGTYMYPFCSRFDENKKGLFVVSVEKGSFGRKMMKSHLFPTEEIDISKVNEQKAKVIAPLYENALKTKMLFKV